jgi:hypothetical protein
MSMGMSSLNVDAAIDAWFNEVKDFQASGVDSYT